MSWDKYSTLDYKMASIISRRINLFSVPKRYSLAHCVSKDLHMGAGIAVEFRRRFKNINTLKLQNKSVREVAFLRRSGGRFIFYLITKENYWDKPTYKNIQLCLRDLNRICHKYNITRLAIPKIACGIDGKQWRVVKQIISKEFQNSPTKVVVCSNI